MEGRKEGVRLDLGKSSYPRVNKIVYTRKMQIKYHKASQGKKECVSN